MTHRINTDKTAAVSNSVYWLPIDDDTPRNVKILAINSSYGVAQITMLSPSNLFFYDSWHPMPQFKKDESE